MEQFAIIIAAASVALGIATWLKIPAIPLLIASGVALASLMPTAEVNELQKALVLGLTFLVFVTGTELNPSRVGHQLKGVLLVSAIQFLVIAISGYLVAVSFDFNSLAAIYLALAVASSSTLVVIRILQQRRQFFEPFGRLVLGVLLIQDLMIIGFISVLSSNDGSLTFSFHGALAAVFLVLITWIFQTKLAPYLLLKLRLDEESLLLTAIAVLFLFAGVANFFDLPIVVGAFFAGVSLSSFPVNGVVRAQVKSLSDFFLAVFFVALGATLSVPNYEGIILSVTLIILLLLITPPLVMFIAERAGLSSRSALESGLLLAQTSEFSLIVAIVGVQQGHIDQSLLSVIALVTVVTMTLTPLISSDAVLERLLKLRSFSGAGSTKNDINAHVVLIGCGQSGRELLGRLRSAGHEVVVIDSDRARVKRLRSEGITAVAGDGADARSLRAAKIKNARLVISTMNRPDTNKKLLRYTRKIPTVVSVFESEDMEALKKSGAIAAMYSADLAESFIQWFEHRFAIRE